MSLKKSNTVVRELPHGLIHAVERLSLGFEWATPLDGRSMARLSALGNQLVDELPRKLEISTSDIRPHGPGSDDEQSGSEDAELFAVMFDDNKDKDGPVDLKHTEIIINNEGMFFTVYARYDGWEVTRALALKLCSVFLEEIVRDISLTAIEIKVANIFGLAKFSGQLSDLLSDRCDSLPRRVFGAQGLWHVDEGYFETHDDQDMRQLLVNLSVSKTLEDDEESLYIRTLHRFEFNTRASDSLPVTKLFDKFEHLHAINKDLLASVLTDDISDALGLFADKRALV
ncbi:hypothetical protein [Pseudomonas sp. Irchel 3A7]|uniref:hypothetical protein n=1 Tax=Pseudomonas sp. Irchel 3A7 TaxID=2008913 RepID=UPI000BA3B939|nr:hypothetical protein [Pseudomonas sp. Irchel 3A7]